MPPRASTGWLLTLRPDGQWQVDRPVNRACAGRGLGLARPPPRPARRRARPARPGAPAARVQPAHVAVGGGAARTARVREGRCAHAGAGAAAAHPPGRLHLHPGAGRIRPRRHRRVLVRPQAGLLRALCRPPSWWRCALSTCRRASVTGYQGADPEPQDGWWIVRQRHAHAWAEYLGGRHRLGAHRPHRRGRARSRAAQLQPAAAAGAGGRCHRHHRPRARRCGCAMPGSRSTTAGTSGC